MSTTSANSLRQTIQFVLNLTRELYKPGTNLVLSPYSLKCALMMLLVGTDGNSRTELANLMFEADTDAATDQHVKTFAELHKTNLAKNEATLRVANLLYSQKDFQLQANYVATLGEQLGAIGRELDFGTGSAAEALQTINSDVERVTNGLIRQVLTAIDPLTRVILVNAIYFKGLWARPFDKEATEETGIFHTFSGQTVSVPLMHKRSAFPFYQDKATGAKAVQLDYKSKEGNIALVLILPREDVPISSYLATQLTASSFYDIIRGLHSGYTVKLTLPRFKMNATHRLVPPLARLGCHDIFDPAKANLSRISTAKAAQLHVSDVIQKAMIEVNEEGTEAAAVTTIVVKCRASKIQQEEDFNANRPFLFALVTKDAAFQQQVLFIGIVEDPTKDE